MKKIFLLIPIFFFPLFALADNTVLAQKLAGRILLQVESKGEAWFINPFDLKKYSLGTPSAAFDLIRNSGIGISDNNLNKITPGFINYGKDADQDGITDSLEKILKTDPLKKDSDQDGFTDKTELENNYNPNGRGKINIDKKLSKELAGKFYLQIEAHGEAWYINPADLKKYYLGSPSDTLQVIKQLGLGVKNSDLEKIITYNINPNQTSTDEKILLPQEVMNKAAEAIRKNNAEEATAYFTPENKEVVKYTLNFLDSEGRLTLGNILSGSLKKSETENEVIFKNEVYFAFGGYKIPVKFILKKTDGRWLISNL